MIRRIYHLADLHFRLFKRHQEYQQVLSKFFKYVDSNAHPDDVIVLAGDIVHSKTEMTPELVQIVSNFLKECADRLPTVLILGNHDLNLKVPSRLDALSPIVESLNHPKLLFWKDSGVYHFNGVWFSVMSVLGEPSEWVLADQISGEYKIAIHHGAVNGSRTDLGFIVENDALTPSKFNGFDITLLGDIHQMQYLNQERTIAYSGSPIQQNHGESLENHGFLVWDISARTSTFVPLENEYGYFTFEFKNGKWINERKNLPKIIRSRVLYENTTKDAIYEILKGLNQNQIIDLVFNKKKQTKESEGSRTNILSIDFRDAENQNILLTEFLQEVLGIQDNEILDELRQLNRAMNSEIRPGQSPQQNVVWRLKQFEFSNMFSFGLNNSVNFENFSGSIGLFAPNASGKSALLSSLLFCLFDKCVVGSKGIHILNNRSSEFHCKVNFQIDSIDYWIERRGKKNEKTGSVKVDVSFWSEDSDGNIQALSGEDRDSTNRIIREYIGTYEDFLMTSLSSQVDNQSFVEKTQRERKELLYRFLNISIFDELQAIAKEKNRDNASILKSFDAEDLKFQIDSAQSKISAYRTSHEGVQREISDISIKITNLLEEINNLSIEITNTNAEYDLESISKKIEEHKKEIEDLLDNRAEIESTRSEIKNNIENSEVDEKAIIDLAEKVSTLDELRKAEDAAKKELLGLVQRREILMSKKDHFSKHEYDPNCKFCVKNSFIADINAMQAELDTVNVAIGNLEKDISSLSQKISEYNGVREAYELESSKKSKHESLVFQFNQCQEKLNSCDDKLESRRERLGRLEEQRVEALKHRQALERNKDLLSEIHYKKNDLSEFRRKEKELNDSSRNIFALLASETQKYNHACERFEEFKRRSKVNQIYDLYNTALSKEGIPYRILSMVLPLLEFEVNEILKNIVDFSIRFEASEDKYIYGYIVYSEEKIWPVEMTSGMERFILNQTIRTALLEISNLSKPNFIAIDEGFGVLDSDNLQSIGIFFNQLREKVDFILCISHIDAMKDMVDDTLTITKESDYSRVYG